MNGRRTLCIVAAVMVLVVSACSSGVSVDSANPVPSIAETPTSPASPVDLLAEDVPPAEEATGAAPSEVEAAESAPAVASVRNDGQQSASEQPTRYETLRDVDFFNDFSYVSSLGENETTVTVVDGTFENGGWDDPEYYWFGVGAISFGDLDRDRIEEAAVVTTWNGGGTGYFDSVTVFRLVDGQPEMVRRVPFGDRADGGVHDVIVADGKLTVWAYAGDQGACCPNAIRETVLVLGEHELVEVEVGPRWSWTSLHGNGASEEFTFLPNTSFGRLTVYGYEQIGQLRFEARAGQEVTVWPMTGPNPEAITIRSVDDPSLPVTTILPVDGYYELTVEFAAEREDSSALFFGIDADLSADAVNWIPQVDQVLLDDDPLVRTSVAWPRFFSGEPNVEAANQELATYASSLDDAWIADVLEYEDALDDSSYGTTYEVTFAGTEIVSVRFDFFDYVCCRAYPTYGQRGAIVDLVEGRILDAGEILDLDRIGEINRLWFAALQDEQSFFAEPQLVEGEDVVRFDSLTLVPGGVEFGTDRGSLGGGLPGTSTALSFAELGDLVNSDLLTRLSD